MKARARRRAFIALARAGLAVASLVSGAARADEPATEAIAPSAEPAVTRAECLDSFDEAQRLRSAGKLLAARVALIACGQSSCPAVVQSQCVQWLRDLNASLPGIVVVARDAAGEDLADVRVSVDGEERAKTADGRVIELDPGPHVLRLERAGQPPVERSLVAVEGQRSREVLVRFEAPPPAIPAAPPPLAAELPPPGPPAPPARLPALFYGGLAVGAAGVLAGSITGAVALSRGSSLRDACGGDVCPKDKQPEIDDGTAIAHASTVSFAVGAAGLAAALVAYATRSKGPRSAAPVATLAEGGLEAGVAGRF